MEERICCKCKIPKSLEDFAKDKYDKSGRTYQCKKCRNEKQKEWVAANPEKVKALNKKHKETRKEFYSNPERKLKYRKASIERTFGIKYSEYERMMDEQNGLCAICFQPETSLKNKYLSVDHCHDTGKIRGLLCNACNRGIGYLKDSHLVIQNAFTYLTKHK